MSSLTALGIKAIFDPRNQTEFGGMGRLAGDAPTLPDDADGRAKILNQPQRVNITVLQPVSFAVVARTLSRPDGTWEVKYLDPTQRFTIIGEDHAAQVNSAIQDWVFPVEME